MIAYKDELTMMFGWDSLMLQNHGDGQCVFGLIGQFGKNFTDSHGVESEIVCVQKLFMLSFLLGFFCGIWT